MEWIDVNERLPEIGVEVLVFTSGAVKVSHLHTWDGETTWYFCGYPTHWMPFPNPPQIVDRKIEEREKK